MTTDRHGDQARDIGDTLSDLQHTLWALQGLEAVIDPGNHLEGEARGNLAMLIAFLAERFEHLLEEAEQRWRNTPVQEGDPRGEE